MSAPAAVAPAIGAQENLLIAGSAKAVSKSAVNLSLVKIGPLIATILGGIFAAITLASAAAIIAIIIVSSAPLPPVASPDFATTNKMVEVRIPVLMKAKDPRGSDLTISSVTKPAHGTAKIIPRVGNVPQQIAYISNQFFSGLDSFNFTIQNTAGATATSYVEVVVMNRPPTAADLYFDNIAKGTEVTVDVLNTTNSMGQKCTDPDTDTLVPITVTNPVTPSNTAVTGAKVEISNGRIQFTPPSTYRGEISFNYTIADVDGATASAKVTLNIVYKAPIATPKLFSFPKATIQTLNLMTDNSDPNGDEIILPWNDPTGLPVSNLAFGSFEQLDNSSIVYTPEIHAYYDSFQYTIQNTGGLKSMSFGSIEMYNRGPSISTTPATVPKNTATYTPLSFTFSDPDAFDTVTVSVDKSGALGDVQFTPTVNKVEKSYYTSGFYTIDVYSYSLKYKPAAGFVGTEKITLTVNDNEGKSDSTASASLEITVTNTAPVANPDSYLCVAGKACYLDLLTNDNDPNGDNIILATSNTFSSVSVGSISRFNSTHALYTPPLTVPSTTSVVFTYAIEDVQAAGYTQFTLRSPVAQVTISVQQNPEDFNCKSSNLGTFVHTGPTSINDLLVRITDSTIPGDSTFSISVSTPSTIGSFAINTVTNVVFTPSAAGSSSVTFNLRRGLIIKNCPATFTVSNAAPTANNVIESYTAKVSAVQYTLDLVALSNAADSDGDSPRLKSVSGTCASASLIISAGKAVFSPTANTAMNCNYNFVITDGVAGNEGTVTKSLQISVKVLPPVAVNDYFEVDQTVTTKVITFADLLANDNDPSGATLQIPSGSAFTGYDSQKVVVNFAAKTVSVKLESTRCDSVFFNYTISNSMNAYSIFPAKVQVKPTNCKCAVPIDILFVLDGSGSISGTNWNNMKNFINGIIDPSRLTLGANNVRVGVIQYAGYATLASPYAFTMQSSYTQASKLTSELSQLGSGTATRDGLRIGYEYMKNNGGARAGTAVSMVLITDGDSNVPCNCKDVLIHEGYYDASQYSYPCANNAYGDGVVNPCNDAWVKQRYPQYANNNYGTCNNCNFNNNRCMPCADPQPVGTTIRNTAGYRLISLGVGDGISSGGKLQIGGLNADGVYRSAPWNDLKAAISLIVDRACDTTAN